MKTWWSLFLDVSVLNYGYFTNPTKENIQVPMGIFLFHALEDLENYQVFQNTVVENLETLFKNVWC